ncbi:hypothetical protein J0910_30090 [Nocardiopsis sp. CNT-189]
MAAATGTAAGLQIVRRPAVGVAEVWAMRSAAIARRYAGSATSGTQIATATPCHP